MLDTGAIAFDDDGAYGIIELPPNVAPTERSGDRPPVYRCAELRVGTASLGAMPLFVIDHPQPPNTHGFLGNVLFPTHRVVIDLTGMMVYIRAAA